MNHSGPGLPDKSFCIDPATGRIVKISSLAGKAAPAQASFADFLTSDMASRKRTYLKALETASREQMEVIVKADRLTSPVKRRRPRSSRPEPA